jgi:hypothetical protein
MAGLVNAGTDLAFPPGVGVRDTGGPMSDTLVVLWRRCDESHELCCEIVQIAEGYFELVVLDDDRVWLREASDDVAALLSRADYLLRGAPLG